MDNTSISEGSDAVASGDRTQASTITPSTRSKGTTALTTKNFLKNSFELPCGVVIKNRLVKSAMTERISNPKLQPNSKHHLLYKKWADTGVGLNISGNIMVDSIHKESSGNVCYSGLLLPYLKEWTTIAKSNDTQVWAQISHAGRQTNRFMSWKPLAPSSVQLHKMGLFGKPKSMTETQILEVIDKFVNTAKLCKEGGFTGVQFHSAHGYLLSQFLSPKTNARTDQWGGCIENRCRLLLTIIEKTRDIVGSRYPIAVKLNSSDFQRGGFTEEESLQVIQMLEGKIDLLEISGGTYEKLAFWEGNPEHEPPKMKQSTRDREAYFLEFSQKVRELYPKLPLLVTGGFRSYTFCNDVLANNEVDFIGMARPFITNLEEIPTFLNGDDTTTTSSSSQTQSPKSFDSLHIKTPFKMLDDAAIGGYYARQLVRLSNGKKLDKKIRPVWSSTYLVLYELKKEISHRIRG